MKKYIVLIAVIALVVVVAGYGVMLMSKKDTTETAKEPTPSQSNCVAEDCLAVDNLATL